jgi:hypothetical protein
VVALTIKEFLLARLSEETDADTAPVRAEIERHNDRSMMVLGGARGPEVRTRCGLCVHEYTRPCRALRRIASRSPGLRPGLDLADRATDVTVLRDVQWSIPRECPTATVKGPTSGRF